ncbi:MAG: hypothetical protein IPO12_01800 [Flavobacteriales bacterium]|nr:hypothetical protein [Flavobacteriales bacterium]
MGLPAIYLCWPGYLVAQEVARRHELTPRERDKAQKLFADHTGRTFYFFRGTVPNTDDHLIIHEPEILPDRYGNVRFTQVLDLNNNRAEAVWQLPYSAMARPDKVTYTSNGGTVDVYYASRDSLALVFHRGGEPDKVYTALSEEYIKSKGRALAERADRIFLQRRDSLNRLTASVTGEVTGLTRTGTNQVEVTLRDSKGIRTAIPFCHGDSLVGGVPLGQWETTIVRPGGEWVLSSRQTLLAREPNRGPEDWIQCEEVVSIVPVA